MTNPSQDSAPAASDRAPDPAELIGTTLAGRYRMERRLGVGGMGAVYLGEHLRMGRKDAIKVLRPELARDPEALARFTRGARAVSKIRHPNVCQVYDFGETDDGFLFLAMEFIDGPSLNAILEKEGRLKVDRAVEFIRQAGEALHVAHELGIIHRDLKPENLMIGRGPGGSEQLKVVDFDIARGTEEEGPGVTRQGFVIGTPEYMSPEQLTGDSLDARSDVYSLALVLFHCLSGRLPFEGTTAQEAMIQRLKVEPLRLSQAAPGRSFPHGLEQAIHAALSKLPDERPSSAPEFVRSVVATLSAGQAAAPTMPLPEAGDHDATRVAPAVSASTGQPAAADATRVLSGATVAAGAAGGASADALPETRAVPGVGGAAQGSSTRKRVVMAGSAAVFAALAVTGFLIFTPALDVAGGPPAVADSVGSTVGGEEGDLASAVPDGSAGAPAVEGPQAGDPGRTTGGETAGPSDPVRTPGGGTNGPETTREPAAVESEPAGPVAGARRITLTADAGEYEGLLFRQFRLIDQSPNQRDVATAARDTAAAVWSSPRVTRPDSAFAAYILGLTLISLSNRAEGIDWLERAVELDPSRQPFRTALDGYRRSGQ